jgi:glycosyltransferase involved in cell wall biosynthesis
MNIGIDITPLQGPHRMRGVGYTLINFINNMSEKQKKDNKFVFFGYREKEAEEEMSELLNLKDIKYEIRFISHTNKNDVEEARVGKSLRNSIRTYRQLRRESKVGDTRINDLNDIDWFLQFDQNQALPLRHKVKSVLVLYDLIPYVMESDYLWSYKTARLKGCSRKGAFRQHLFRKEYIKNIQRNIRRARKIIAISEYTKQDVLKYLRVRSSKIKVVLLGSETSADLPKHVPKFEKYAHTSWGYLPQKVDIDSNRFIMFMGGADPRRKLVDLVATFNNLRGQGEDIKLVLAGDTMQGAFKVPNKELQAYLKHHTSYLDDIYFLGFVDEEQKSWLYNNALAFIYPSRYEGFGLPILEAMSYGTPVITYRNTSITEVAGDAAIYTNGYLDIVEQTKKLIDNPKLKDKYKKLGQLQAAKFSWEKTTKNILDVAD